MKIKSHIVWHSMRFLCCCCCAQRSSSSLEIMWIVLCERAARHLNLNSSSRPGENPFNSSQQHCVSEPANIIMYATNSSFRFAWRGALRGVRIALKRASIKYTSAWIRIYTQNTHSHTHTHTSSAFSIDVRVCTLFCVHIYIYIFVALLWMDASAGAATWDWALPALAQQTRGAHFITQTQSTYDSRPQRLLFQSLSLLSFALRVFRPRVVLIYFPVFAVCVARAPREVRARTAYHPHIHTCAILKCLIFLMRGIPKRHKHILYRLCRGS